MARYKIVKMDKKMSKEDMEGYKNFDTLLKAHNKSILFKRVLVTVVVISLVVSAAIFWHSITDVKVIVNNIEPAPSGITTIADSAKTRAEVDSLIIKTKPVKTSKKKDRVTIKKVKEKETVPIYEEQPFSFTKAYPTYGLDSLMNYFNNELKRENISQIQGILLVAFEIDGKGKPASIKILQSLSKEVDNEIIELIKLMPPWSPAMMNGKLVSSTTTLPIKIDINLVTQ